MVIEDKKRNNRRRIYYIKESFQKNFIVKYISLVVVSVVLANGVLYALLLKNINDALYKAHISIESTGDVIIYPLFLASLAVVLSAVAGAVVILFITTKRVSSCMNSLLEGISGLKDGDFTTSLEGEYNGRFADLFDSFNKAVTLLNGRVRDIKEELDGMHNLANSHLESCADIPVLILERVANIENHLQTVKLKSE